MATYDYELSAAKAKELGYPVCSCGSTDCKLVRTENRMMNLTGNIKCNVFVKIGFCFDCGKEFEE